MNRTIKEVGRALLYPWRRYFDPRLQNHDIRIEQVLRRVEALEWAMWREPPKSPLEEHLPAVLNAISSQNAVSREAKRTELELRSELAALKQHLAKSTELELRSELAALEQRLNDVVDGLGPQLDDRIATVQDRVEFVRREIMFEGRYGGRDKGMGPGSIPSDAPAAPPDEGPLRLNLGCGHTPLEGFVNVDGRSLPGVDWVAEVGALPAEPGTVDEIYAAHLMEHFPLEELRRRLLPYWLSLLRPGGSFTAVVPDSETMIAEYAQGRLSFEDLRTVTFGEQEYDGDFHFNMFSKALMCDLLKEAGFADVRLIEEGRRNGMCYEMEVSCERPSVAG